MYRFKNITAIFLCLAMICSFTACGGKKTKTPNNKKPVVSNSSVVSQEESFVDNAVTPENQESQPDNIVSDQSGLQDNSSIVIDQSGFTDTSSIPSEESSITDSSSVPLEESSTTDTSSAESEESSTTDISSVASEESSITDNSYDESEATSEQLPSTDNTDSSNDVVSDTYPNENTNSNTSSDDEEGMTDRYIPTVEDLEQKIDEADKEHETKSADWKGPSGYVIVIPKNNETCKESAEILKNWFKKNAKVDLKIVTDTTKANKKEIVIGKTNRYTYSVKDGEYFAKLSGDKLIFGGGHDVTIRKAIEIYTRMEYKKGKAYTFSGKSDFVGKKLGYTYVWGDEFETNTLDLTKWNRSTKMAATAEMTLDDTELTTKVENGYLKMFALRYWDPKKAGAEYVVPWSVTTMKTMSYRYGYIEIRAKVPFIRGVWPSFWTSSSGALNEGDYVDKYGYSTEIDIFEVFSSLDTLSPNIHKWYGDGRHTMWAVDEGNSNEWYKFESDDLINEYHTYGFEWTPTEMTMYIDDKPYYTYDLTVNFDEDESGMGGFEAPIYLIFNNHLFTGSSTYKPYQGCEVRSTDLPAEYFIDWVRLYQKNDGKSQLNLAN